LKNKLKNTIKKHKNKLLVFAGILFICFVAFLFHYINNINIYGDFSLEIYQHNINVSDKITVKGVSFFNREHELEYHSGKVHSETWYYKELRFYIPDSIDKDYLYIIPYADDFEYDIKTEILLAGGDFAVIKNLTGDKRFIDKLRFFFPLNWLNTIRLIIFIMIISLTFIINTTSLRNLIQKYQIIQIRYYLFGLIFTSAIILRFSTPLTALLAFDYTGHIQPVIKYLVFDSFDHYEWSYPYPLFIISVLSIFKDINIITVIQHSLSIIISLGFIILIEKHYRHRIIKLKSQVLYTLTTTLFLGTILLNGNLIIYEKCVHHEGLIIPSILLITSVLFIYFKESKHRYHYLIYGISIFSLFFLSLLQYRFTPGFMIIAFLILVWETRITIRLSKIKALLPISIFIILYLIVFIPERVLVSKYDKTAQSFAYTQFMYSNAPTVLKLIYEDKTVEPEYDSIILKHHILDALNNPNQETYKLLAYNFDYLKYKLARPELVKHINLTYFRDSSQNYVNNKKRESQKFADIYNNYYKNWAKLILKEYPADPAKKTFKQLINMFLNPEINYISYFNNNSYQNPAITDNEFCRFKYLDNNYKLKSGMTINIDFPVTKSNYFSLISLFIKLAFIVAMIFSAIRIFKRPFPKLIFCLFIIISTTLMTVAILHSFDILRYLHTLLPFIMSLVLFSVIEISKLGSP
jgi:hypothetical protein